MKIVYVSENFPPNTFGGGELSGYTLAKYLASDPKFEVHVVTKALNGKESHENVDNIHNHRVIQEGSMKLPDDIRRGEILTHNTTKHLKPYLKDANLVHTLSMRVTIGAYKAARREKLPIIATVNDTWATCYYSLHFKKDDICWNCSMRELKDCLEQFGGNKLVLPYLIRNMKTRAKTLKKFDCLLPRSKLIEKILRKNGFSNRMEIFPPIIDIEKYQYKEPIYKNQILYVGRLDRGKGVEDAILALKHSKKGKLAIVGNGPYKKYFEGLALKHELGNRVIFKGKFTEDEVIQEIHNSDLILAPFRRIEPMPRIIPESFACGRGIITTNCCGGNELIINDENGFTVSVGAIPEIGKLIDRILGDKKLVKSLGMKGRKCMEKELHPDKIIEDYKIIIQELVN